MTLNTPAAWEELKNVVVPIAEYGVSADPRARLVTYSLGSCIAVCLHDVVRSISGMIHFMLPLSSMSPDRAAEEPAMFGDTGIPLLFRSMYDLGCQKNDIVVKLVGGGVMLDSAGIFNVGAKNRELAVRILRKNSIAVDAEDTGGSKSRTVKLDVRTGRVVVFSRGLETEL